MKNKNLVIILVFIFGLRMDLRISFEQGRSKIFTLLVLGNEISGMQY